MTKIKKTKLNAIRNETNFAVSSTTQKMNSCNCEHNTNCTPLMGYILGTKRLQRNHELYLMGLQSETTVRVILNLFSYHGIGQMRSQIDALVEQGSCHQRETQMWDGER